MPLELSSIEFRGHSHFRCERLRKMKHRTRLALYASILASATIACSLHAQQQAQPASPVAEVSAALRRQDFDTALQLSAAALRTSPQDLRLLTLRGVAFAGKHDFPAAMATYQKALKLSPDFLPALESAAQLAYQQRDPQARPLLVRILNTHPEEPTAQAMLGSLDYRAKDCPAAVEHFAKADTALARQPEALMEYGACLANLNRLPEAVPVLEQALALNPESPVARYNLALAQSDSGHAEDALATLAPLTTQPAPAEDVLTLAADIAESKNDTQHAVELLRQAILAHPRDKAAYLQFAYLSYKHSSVQVGIDMLNAGLTQMPKEAELYIARGVLLSQTTDATKAADDFDTAAKLAPNLSFAAAAQGISHAQSHDPAAALATFRAAARQHPDDALTQYLLAEELSNEAPEPGTPAFQEGITAAKRSSVLDPKRAETHDLLAALYLRSDQINESIAESAAALAIDPNDEQALYHQIIALRKTDRKAEVPDLVKRMAKVRADKAAEAMQAKPNAYRLVEAAPQ